MKCYVADTLIGIFAFDESGNVLNFIDFNGKNQKIIEFYESLEKGIILEEYNDLIMELKSSGFKEFIFDNKTLQMITSEKLGVYTELERLSLEFKNFRFNLETQVKKVGINISRNEIIAKYKEVNAELVKKKVSIAGGKNDLVIIQIIETLDILKKSISLFSSRLKEWYGLHFPELTDKLIEDNIILAKFISILGHRKNFTIENIKNNFFFNEKRIEILSKQASESMGADIELTIIQGYANQILSLNSYREELELFLEDLMEKVAPNIKAIVGDLIGAKLIAKAGGLKKLAYMPASRIQLLGAEKALYRFLKTGEKRPKHGLIFQWNQIRGSKPFHRGKIARLIAGKVGLASKIDHFSGKFIGDSLSSEIESKIRKIELKYPNPKPLVKTQPTKKKNQERVKKKEEVGDRIQNEQT
ncbi:MAG: C/D box methylation guide ribonucleoprotein complex aNOP56 subunit [Promethearchaeota archaeon]